MVGLSDKIIAFRNQIDNGVDADNYVSKVVERDGDDGAYDAVDIMAWLATADQRVTAESGIARYLEEIRRGPMLEPQDEFILAKRWSGPGGHRGGHKLLKRHPRTVARTR